MIKIDSTCKGCTERHLGCHQDCKDYIDAKDKYDKEKEAVKEKKAIEKAATSYEKERIRMALRRKGIKA